MSIKESLFKAAGVCVCSVVASSASAVVIDFETEDDFVTSLINGQIVDAAFDGADLEFGNLITISSSRVNPLPDGNLGATIFDSDPADQLPGTQDPDLLIGTGNILILQNDESPATTLDATHGLLYDFPNDEDDGADRGSLLINFLSPVEPRSVDLIDVNGGVEFDVILTDVNNLTRTYSAGPRWTTDVTVNPSGFKTLDLTTLADQPGEPLAIGGPATAVEDAGYDPFSVVSLEVAIGGSRPSGGIDNLVFVPEPATAALAGFGVIAMLRRRR